MLDGNSLVLQRLQMSLTISWPVTRMMIPPVAVGWASGGPYSCLTFWNGRDCWVALSVFLTLISLRLLVRQAQTYSKLLSNTLGTERLGTLEGEHRVVAL